MAEFQNSLNDKASRKILGMAVYSIAEGQNLGLIKGLIIDGKEHSLLALVVEKKRLTKDERILPFKAVSSIGDDVITIERLGLLERPGANQQLIKAIRRPIQPLGARCFTADGKTMGKVEECYFNAAGQISRLEISEGGLFKGRLYLPGELIIAMAPATIMLKEQAIKYINQNENNLIASMEMARDKAAAISRGTVNALNSSLQKILPPKEEFEISAKALPGEDALLIAQEDPNIKPANAKDSLPNTSEEAALLNQQEILLKQEIASASPSHNAELSLPLLSSPKPKMSPIMVSVQNPEDIDEHALSVNLELADRLKVEADLDDIADAGDEHALLEHGNLKVEQLDLPLAETTAELVSDAALGDNEPLAAADDTIAKTVKARRSRKSVRGFIG